MTELFSKVLNMSLTGSVVIAFVLAARLLLRRSPKIYAYVLWAAVLFRLLCPISLSSSVSLLGWLQPEVQEMSPATSTISYLPAEAFQPRLDAPAAPAERAEQTEILPESAPFQWEDLAARIWVAGVSVMALYSLTSYLRLRGRLAESMHCRDNIYLSDRIDSPFVMGLLRPRIYLPSVVPVQERPYILAHEQHHIRRGDPLWKLLGYCALCIHWFNPLVWAAFVLAGKDMEMSCDEAVIRQLGADIRADYSASLLRLATHRRVISGMPLAFGEGDTRGRVLNMARWKKPRVWVSILCAVLSIAVLAACALNPRQEETETNEKTQIVGPARIVIRDFRFRIPAGCITEKREKKIHEQTDDGLDVAYWEFIDGESIIGGVNTFRIPENFSADNWDWLQELDLPEWEDNTLGYYADGFSGKYSLEFFSDVPDGVEREVLRCHNFFPYGDWFYDIWFDELVASTQLRDSILRTVQLGEAAEPALAAQIQELPDGYSYLTSESGSIQFTDGKSIIGGIESYPIPEGVYDPSDDVFLWLEDVGIPDFEDDTLAYIGGGSFWDDRWTAEFISDVPPGTPSTVHRRHTFCVVGGFVYDIWFDMLQIDMNIQSQLLSAVVLPTAQVPETTETQTEEEIAFEACRAVLDAVQSGSYRILSEYNYEQDGPTSHYTYDYAYADGDFLCIIENSLAERHAVLYANDQLFHNRGHWSDPELIWSERTEDFSFAPWLASFYFVKQNVSHLYTQEDETGVCYKFSIEKPFADGEDYAPVYYVDFYFDSEGNFLRAVIWVNLFLENEFTITESIITMDKEAISNTIAQEYLRATN